MNIKDFINRLDEDLSKNTYSEKEITRVNLTYTEEAKPGEEGSQLPPSDEQNIELNPDAPKSQPDKGKEGEGKEGEGKEDKGKEGKPGKDKGKGKEGKPGKDKGKEIEGKPSKGKEGSEGGEPGEEGEGGKIKSEKTVGKAKPSQLDSHVPLDLATEASGERIAREIMEEAEELENEIREKRGSQQQGSGAGGFGSLVKKYRKPLVDWKRLLKNKVNTFISRNAESEGGSEESWARWYKKHREGMGGLLRKGEREAEKPESIVMLVAADTSGSIGQNQLNQFFTELDSLAQRFESSSQGARVYFMNWDGAVENVVEYKHKDLSVWEKGEKKAVGGGGTDPTCIFKFIDGSIVEPEKSGIGVMRLMGKPNKNLKEVNWEDKDNIVIDFKMASDSSAKQIKAKRMPLLIIMTDGYFGKLSKSNIGEYYKYHEDKIVWVIMNGETENLYPKDNIIEID